jgi:alkylation response protein AidB-like acyl-CoA dehydrogenase
LEIIGGQRFHEGFSLERLFRDVQVAKYHPLSEKEQQQFLGEYILDPKPATTCAPARLAESLPRVVDR